MHKRRDSIETPQHTGDTNTYILCKNIHSSQHHVATSLLPVTPWLITGPGYQLQNCKYRKLLI